MMRINQTPSNYAKLNVPMPSREPLSSDVVTCTQLLITSFVTDENVMKQKFRGH